MKPREEGLETLTLLHGVLIREYKDGVKTDIRYTTLQWRKFTYMTIAKENSGLIVRNAHFEPVGTPLVRTWLFFWLVMFL